MLLQFYSLYRDYLELRTGSIAQFNTMTNERMQEIIVKFGSSLGSTQLALYEVDGHVIYDIRSASGEITDHRVVYLVSPMLTIPHPEHHSYAIEIPLDIVEDALIDKLYKSLEEFRIQVRLAIVP